ncbi:hypothetical protein QMZ05_02240 [Bradyrhizobium sp. INPA03-11B]|uniref:dCTP deaminase n=1 Tax=Bradyrhizobium sp. INPA03-11B TaxID=418598 RepID=UPI00338D8C2E
MIDPFSSEELNPNSYNYRLADTIKILRSDGESEETRIPEGGLLLMPKHLYLGATHEFIASCRYAITLLGRSSVGRLGIFLNATADLGHVGSASRWTLEISVVQPVVVYPYMKFGQVAFWESVGPSVPYQGSYLGDTEPERCKDGELIEAQHRA